MAPALAAGLEEHLADQAGRAAPDRHQQGHNSFPDLAGWAGHVTSLREITGKNIQAALDDQPPVAARNLLPALPSLFLALAPPHPGQAPALTAVPSACAGPAPMPGPRTR